MKNELRPNLRGRPIWQDKVRYADEHHMNVEMNFVVTKNVCVNKECMS